MSNKSKKTFQSYINNQYNSLTEKFTSLIGSSAHMNDDDSISFKFHNEKDDIFDIYKNNKFIMTVKYEILGSHDIQCGLFMWSRSMPFMKKNFSQLSRKIKKDVDQLKKMVFDEQYHDSEFIEKIIYYAQNNIFYIFNENINDLVKFSVVIGNCMGVVKQTSKLSDTKFMNDYYLITDIIGT